MSDPHAYINSLMRPRVTRPNKQSPTRKQQRGAALLFVVLLIILGVGLFAVSASEETRVTVSDSSLTQALNTAKQALIAKAVAHPGRPGALPCPDADDDGIADPPGANACTRNIGRLPWLTLGVGDLRDASGERLWYALSPNFADAGAINSDTKGTGVVHSGSNAVTQTSEAVAVVFAPGGVLAGQIRDSTSANCVTTGTTMARTWCAANYLDTAATVNNASLTGPYISADQSAAFNDRLIVLRTSDIVPLVERRVAGDLRRVLLDYRNVARKAVTGDGCNCYPWADGDNDGTSNVGVNRGRVPLSALPKNWGALVKDGLGTLFMLPTLPAYFQPNGWHTVIFYTVGRNASQNFGLSPTACTTCTPDPLLPPPTLLKGTLSIDANIGHAVVLMTLGSAGASRPSANWGDYIDDSANRDGDDRFVTPQSKSVDRDRLWTIPDDLPPASCRTNAQLLIRSAPCHTTGSDVKPVCAKAASNLQFCTQCSGDGTVMVVEPCRNTLSPPECEAAVTKLQTCKL